MQAHATYTKMIHCQDARKLANTIKQKCPDKHCTIRYVDREGTLKTRFVSFCKMHKGLLDIAQGQVVDIQEFSSQPGLIAFQTH